MDYRTLACKIVSFIEAWLEKKASHVSHASVTKSVYLEVEISAGYFLVLTIANLIALGGLITNNVAVIIGAMLISPLMGPILSSGFAFITENTWIGKQALKKIVLSMLITIIVAAAATYISPLKDATDEILSRTRPNLYDLIIAFLAGTVGAMALCTKRDYLTIVPGVAIATAVIPPLSVTGYGMGSGNFLISLGGFSLFFTNFAAIVISTCIVFFVYGFRPGMTTEFTASQLRRRLVLLGFILLVISIPLLYTLHKSIVEVRLRSNVSAVLTKDFNREKSSHLAAFSYTKGQGGSIDVNVIINTVSYMGESEIEKVQKDLKDAIGGNTRLNVEQVLVQAGGLKPPAKIAETGALAPSKPPVPAVEGTVDLIRKTKADIENIISPSTVDALYVGYGGDGQAVPVIVRIRRDAPLSEEERSWLGRVISGELKKPVALTVEAVPFVQPLVFKKGETALTPEMKSALSEIRKAYGRDPSISITIESYTGRPDVSWKRKKLAEERAENIAHLLTEEYKIPSASVHAFVHMKAKKEPAVMVSITARGAK